MIDTENEPLVPVKPIGQLQPEVTVEDEEDVDNRFIGQEEMKMTETHDETQKYINHIFSTLIYVIFSLGLTYSMRLNIFILFAKTFDDSSLLIGIFIYFSYLMTATVSLIFSIVGSKWRFDHLLIIATIFDIICFAMEATAINIWMLGIAFTVGAQPFQAIVGTWILKYNSPYYAKRQQARNLICWTCGLILGPIIGGIISDWYTYRTVFYVSLIFACLLFCIVFYLVNNIEPDMKRRELEMKPLYDYFSLQSIPPMRDDRNRTRNNIMYSDTRINERWKIWKEYRFPICVHPNKVDNIWHEFLYNVDKYEIFLWFLLTVCQCCTMGTEAIMTSYFTAYMHYQYSVTTTISSLQYSLYAIGYGIGNIIGKKLLNMAQKQKLETSGTLCEGAQYFFGYSSVFVISSITACSICVVLTGIILPYKNILKVSIFASNNEYVNIIGYWLGLPVYGFWFGIAFYSILCMTIDVMPKKVVGIMHGITQFGRILTKGMMCLIVGALWDVSYDYLWFVSMVAFGVTLFIIIVIIIIEAWRCRYVSTS